MAEPALNTATLYELSDKWAELERMIGDPEIDADMLADAFNDVEDAFEEKARRCALMFRNWAAAEIACKAEIDRITKRKKSFVGKMDWMKGYLRSQMQKLKLKKLEDPVLPISLRAGALSVQIECAPEDLPSAFTEPRTEFVPDKNLIAKVLKAHEAFNQIEHDTRLSDEQREAKQDQVMGAFDKHFWSYIESGIQGARLNRGDDIIQIG